MTKKNKGTRRQGLGSWATSVVAMVIGFSNVFVRGAEALKLYDDSGVVDHFPRAMIQDFTGLNMPNWSFENGWDFRNLGRGYAPPLGAIAMKKSFSELTRRAPVRQLFPSA